MGDFMPNYTPPSGGSGTIDGTLTTNRIPFASDSDTLTDDADFSYDSTNDLLAVTKVLTQVVVDVHNATGSAIPAGTPVYVTGSVTSGKPNVEPSDANNAATMPSVGIVTNNIGAGSSGYIAISGLINGISTSIITDVSPAAGDTLYISTTVGELTTTKPTGTSDLIQNVGRILSINGGNFKMTVNNLGRTNDIPNQFTTTGSQTASAHITTGGASTDFVKGDGTLDANTYLTSFTETDPVVGAINGIVKANGGGTISAATAGTDYATGAQGAKADSAQQPPSEGAFVDGDKTKLDGIEVGADVTDTVNVTAAGALMDSEVTNLAFVKGLTGGISNGNVLVANAAVADNDFLKIDGTSVEGRTAAEMRTDLNVADGATANAGTVTSVATTAPITGGTITGSGTIGISAATTSAAGSMSGADKTKLDGIEASADVTDTTNVTAAGALMDSEVTNLAQVKAFDSADYATAAQGVKADSALQPFQHLRLNLTNNSLARQTDSTDYFLDLANTSNYTNTGNTSTIIVTNDTTAYISLAAGGLYMVVASVEMFTAVGTAAQDFWLQLGDGTGSSTAIRNWGTARFKVKEVPTPGSDCAINMQKTVIIDVASTGSAEKLYIAARVNGSDYDVKAYDNNRTNITVTRIGDSTS